MPKIMLILPLFPKNLLVKMEDFVGCGAAQRSTKRVFGPSVSVFPIRSTKKKVRKLRLFEYHVYTITVFLLYSRNMKSLQRSWPSEKEYSECCLRKEDAQF